MHPNSSTTGIPDGEAGSWPLFRTRVLDWLVHETRTERFLDRILVEMCRRIANSGIPLTRASMHFRLLHPQWMGARMVWRTGLDEAEIDTFDFGIETTPQYLKSPAHDIYCGTDEIRSKLTDTGSGKQYPLYDDLRKDGLIEYLAWPLEHTFGKRHVVTFATDAKSGFGEEHVSFLKDLVPILSLVTEIRAKNILSRTMLETYVGPHASEQILAGATRRGSGTTVSAAIMICDIRDFTALSDLWPRDEVIGLLNTYFDAMCEPIEARGGEILKFMGDGLLAVFPLSNPDACGNLLAAIREGRAAMDAFNSINEERGLPVLRYGVGVHVGDIMYGNIGSRKRLDFTAIGPAVNVASRLESLTKKVKRPVLISGAFAATAGTSAEFEDLGPFPLRGLGQPVDVLALLP